MIIFLIVFVISILFLIISNLKEWDALFCMSVLTSVCAGVLCFIFTCIYFTSIFIPSAHQVDVIEKRQVLVNKLESYDSINASIYQQNTFLTEIINFNKETENARKYSCYWLLRWVAYDPAYIDIKPIKLTIGEKS